MRRERFANNAVTTLSAGINDSVTSVTVTDGSVFPSEGDFRIIVNEEIMIVTARSTNTLTVVRGAESTTAASQSSGATVRMILTAGAIDQYITDIVGGANDRNPYRIMNQSGTTLTSTDFTWVNQGTATATDEDWGGITMTLPAVGGAQLRILKIAAPAAPWTLTCNMQFGVGYNFGTTIGGICARENSSGKIQTCTYRAHDVVAAWRYNTATSYNGLTGSEYDHITDDVWLQLEDNNTNIIARVSSDGINWFQIGSAARGSFPTGSAFDEVGFYVNNNGGAAGMLVHFNSWILE